MTPGPHNSPPDNDPLEPALLDRYLAGECPPEAVERLERWIADGHGRRAWIEGLRQGVSASMEYPPMSGAPQMRERVFSVVAPAPIQRKISRRISRRMIAGMSVIVSVLLILFIAVPRLHREPTRLDGPVRTYVAGVGQRLPITLDDGVRVILAPRTTLAVHATFIALTGEARFDVPHHTRRPFIVRTGNVTTRVLGTRFDVRRYSNDRSTQVVVLEGRVTTGVRRHVVLPTHVVALVNDSAVTVTQGIDAETLPDWTNDHIVFRDAPARDVFALVSRWYGVTIHFTDSALAGRRLNATLDARWSRAGMLAVLGSALEAQTTVRHDTVTITPYSGGPPAPSRREREFTAPLLEVGR